MKMKFKIILYSVLGLLLIEYNCYSQKKDFKIFDAIMINDKPDLTKKGMSYINMIYQEEILDINLNIPNKGVVSEPKFKKLYSKINPKYPICLNIESWSLSDEYIDLSIPKYISVLNKFKKKYMHSKIAYAGIVPNGEFDFSKVKDFKKEKADWRSSWNKLGVTLKVVAKKQDFICPVAYATSSDREVWLAHLKEVVKKSKEIAPLKKVYVFLWPQYFNRNEDYNETFLYSDFWQFQLESVYEYSDGVILWMPPYNVRMMGRIDLKWNEGDGWWIKTQEFIKSKRITGNVK